MYFSKENASPMPDRCEFSDLFRFLIFCFCHGANCGCMPIDAEISSIPYMNGESNDLCSTFSLMLWEEPS